MYLVPRDTIIRPRALLVEDDPDIQHLLRRVLARRGYIVTWADDGDLGLQLARMFVFDVIISDVMMPKVSGIEMVAGIRAHEAAHDRPRVPIIAMTASEEPSIRERCDRAGVTILVRKPLHVAQLEKILSLEVIRRPCVLVVADRADTRADIVTKVGASRDTQILEAHSAYRALEQISTQRVDMVVACADWVRREGAGLASTIRRLDPYAAKPLIAVTRSAEEARGHEARFAEDFVVKPLEELDAHLARACA